MSQRQYFKKDNGLESRMNVAFLCATDHNERWWAWSFFFQFPQYVSHDLFKLQKRIEPRKLFTLTFLRCTLIPLGRVWVKEVLILLKSEIIYLKYLSLFCLHIRFTVIAYLFCGCLLKVGRSQCYRQELEHIFLYR